MRANDFLDFAFFVWECDSIFPITNFEILCSKKLIFVSIFLSDLFGILFHFFCWDSFFKMSDLQKKSDFDVHKIKKHGPLTWIQKLSTHNGHPTKKNRHESTLTFIWDCPHTMDIHLKNQKHDPINMFLPFFLFSHMYIFCIFIFSSFFVYDFVFNFCWFVFQNVWFLFFNSDFSFHLTKNMGPLTSIRKLFTHNGPKKQTWIHINVNLRLFHTQRTSI